jgi:hypothetical protein
MAAVALLIYVVGVCVAFLLLRSGVQERPEAAAVPVESGDDERAA